MVYFHVIMKKKIQFEIKMINKSYGQHNILYSPHILSKSKNSCFINHQLKGKVYGVFSNNQLILNHE